MWYYNLEQIKNPKSMEINNVTYPSTIFRDSNTLTSLGIKPMRIVTVDSRYYHNGAYTVDASGAEVVGTYAGNARSVAMLKTGMLSKANSAAASRHADIDWYWTRAQKGGTAVPTNVANWATALYSEHETIKTAIAALSDLAGVIAYENKPHTETRKVQNDDGSYHASETTTHTRHIDMTTFFTVNPTKAVDLGFVSLVAD